MKFNTFSLSKLDQFHHILPDNCIRKTHCHLCLCYSKTIAMFFANMQNTFIEAPIKKKCNSVLTSDTLKTTTAHIAEPNLNNAYLSTASRIHQVQQSWVEARHRQVITSTRTSRLVVPKVRSGIPRDPRPVPWGTVDTFL
jgi:hypothetical protein